MINKSMKPDGISKEMKPNTNFDALNITSAAEEVKEINNAEAEVRMKNGNRRYRRYFF